MGNLRLNMMFRTGLLLLVCAVGAHAYSSGFASGSSFSSGYASGSSYSSGYTSGSTPTSSPTPAPAATHEIVATVQLNGISKAQFTTAAQTSFKGLSHLTQVPSADLLVPLLAQVRMSQSPRSQTSDALALRSHSRSKSTPQPRPLQVHQPWAHSWPMQPALRQPS